MTLTRRGARFHFSKADYSRGCLAAAAAALGEGVEVFVKSAGSRRRVELRFARPPGRARLRAAAGAFIDAALNHAYRQRLVRYNRHFSAAVMSSVLAKSFRPVPADPLEQLEPQVRADRQSDLQALWNEAKSMEDREPADVS